METTVAQRKAFAAAVLRELTLGHKPSDDRDFAIRLIADVDELVEACTEARDALNGFVVGLAGMTDCTEDVEVLKRLDTVLAAQETPIAPPPLPPQRQ